MKPIGKLSLAPQRENELFNFVIGWLENNI